MSNLVCILCGKTGLWGTFPAYEETFPTNHFFLIKSDFTFINNNPSVNRDGFIENGSIKSKVYDNYNIREHIINEKVLCYFPIHFTMKVGCYHSVHNLYL